MHSICSMYWEDCGADSALRSVRCKLRVIEFKKGGFLRMRDSETIFRKLGFMSRCVKYLRSVDPENVNPKFDYEKRSAIERNFQLAVESAIYLGEIIISEEGFERPQDYESVFLVLGRHSILPEAFAERFASAAGFRNVLVHVYEEVDLRVLEEFLTERLGDFEEFAGYVLEYIEKKETKVENEL